MLNLIDRSRMPQIDASDIPALVDWLTFRGVSVRTVYPDPDSLTLRQRTIYQADRMPRHAPSAPVLISADQCVLDGNHRTLRAQYEEEASLWCLEIGLPFSAALAALFSFAGTYVTAKPEPRQHSVAEAERMADLGYI